MNTKNNNAQHTFFDYIVINQGKLQSANKPKNYYELQYQRKVQLYGN